MRDDERIYSADVTDAYETGKMHDTYRQPHRRRERRQSGFSDAIDAALSFHDINRLTRHFWPPLARNFASFAPLRRGDDALIGD